ncbi:hypothetical protein E3O47_12410 [Cryobacterium sp. TMT2-17-1]|uniref:hypothetical protein n=1 Tax=Cryobacterium sp. TMT2-17-1 TaxID=1259248 RepID=UPI00106D604B|nr:hypothetical protein [Cryobacterium sp. TMT2-17-1]TFC49062.1 hypothetical protein E3O47_12410 [Cryobacterium sp. TMT2-17-1]
MVAYGYLAYLIRIAPPNRPRYLQRLSEFGPDQLDLLTEVDRELKMLGDAFYRNDGMAEGYRLKSHNRRGRSISLKMRRGPVGNPGEMLDVESLESVEAGRTKALLSEFRASFYIPRDSYYGFLFVERIGGRHLKDLLYHLIAKKIGLRTSMGVRMEGFALTDDWRKELAGKQVLRVTEVLAPSDSAHDPSTVEDLTVRVSVEGAGLTTRDGDLKERIFELLERKQEELRQLVRIAPLEARRKVIGETHRRDGTVIRELKKAPRDAFTVADEEEWRKLVDEIEVLHHGPSSADLEADLQAVLPVDRDE